MVSPDAVGPGPDDDVTMQILVVERHLVGWTTAEVDQLLRRIEAATARFAAAGVRHLGSLVLPTDEICLGLFEGPDADTVAAVNRDADLRVDRVLAGRTAAFVPMVA